MGASRRQHHRQQEAMRAATAESNRFEAMMRAQEEANQRMAEALKPDLSALKAPKTAAPANPAKAKPAIALPG